MYKVLSTFIASMSLWASAQLISDLPDFTTIDITQMYNDWAKQQNAQMEVQLQQIIAQVMQDPRFQSMYQQYIMSGGTATAEQYAYSYAATGGFTPQGMQIYQNSEALSAAKIQSAWQGYLSAVQGYRDAYGNYVGGFSGNKNEFGNMLMGNSTYIDPGTGYQHVIPHTWNHNSYNIHNGQTYYVDDSGQYYWVDPNNTGWMWPIYR